MNNKILSRHHSMNLPASIKNAIQEVLEEDEAYVADELVELSEVVLLELAALGFAAYLNQPKQKSVFNDFLLQLFTSKSQAYNAGPLYRWAANMIKDLDTDLAAALYPLFWEEVGGTTQLNSKIHHLALLRNEVMHGFFLLPPERNHKEATHIAEVIEDVLGAQLFTLLAEDKFHFLIENKGRISFSGHWAITEEEWSSLEGTHSFAALALNIRHQLSPEFDAEQAKWLEQHKTNHELDSEISGFLENKRQGAFAFWHRPNTDSSEHAANTYAILQKSDTFLPQFLDLSNEGLTFSSSFILGKLVKVLAADTGATKYSRDAKKAIKELRKKCEKQPVVIIKDIHRSLFQEDHLLHLADFFFENNILLVGFGIHYAWIDQFFNSSKEIQEEPYIPDFKEWSILLENYLRFKGPNKEFENERKDFELIQEIIKQLLFEASKGDQIVARRFADAQEYPMEYVHESFAFLHPYLKFGKMPFEKDVLDELYSFPKEITEASRIYFSIGRRDAKLEYQHQTLSL